MCDVLPAFSFVVVFLLGGTVRCTCTRRLDWIGSRALVYLKSFSPIKILGLIFEHIIHCAVPRFLSLSCRMLACSMCFTELYEACLSIMLQGINNSDSY